VNNPLPVDPFSVAEAARRTWPALIEAMIEAVCLVEPQGLRVVAANGAAGRLFGVEPSDLIGRDMRETAATPEDDQFWRRVAESAGACANIHSDAYITRPGGDAVPVVRRVSRIEPAPGNALYVLALRDRSEQVRVERSAEVRAAELAATLESIGDGVLVVDLAGHISHFNRPFAALWSVPNEMLQLRADDEIFEWMRQQVVDPVAYLRRLKQIEAEPRMRSTDAIALGSGAFVERRALPQLSRGRVVGRVFSFRAAEAAR
jgi:PAS domain S-box-containing protein